MNRYKLVKAEDGQIWMPIQAMMEDIKESCHKLEDLPQHLYEQMNEQDKEIFMLKIKGLDTIYQFLGALLVEHALKSMRDEDKALYNINQEIEKASQNKFH